jgi:dTDP-4-amino-4,6-dideoxygalactose transaminase
VAGEAPDVDAAPLYPHRGDRAVTGQRGTPAAPASHTLALLGGAPAFSAPLHVGAPNIGNRDRFLERVNDILDRRWLTNGGAYELEFEKRLARMLEVKHCVAVANGTLALELTLRAAGLTGEVILPSFTFVATAHVLRLLGLQPVFCDIDPVRYTVDPHAVEALITPRTSAILAVHLWGHSCDAEALDAIARHHGLALIFDAAHALRCSRRGRPIGGFGLAETFSFHATKFVNSFEGGAITTNDDNLARAVRLRRNFGFVWYDQVETVGTNAKLSEIAAAMGLTSLESVDDFIRANRRNDAAYRAALSAVPGITVADYDEQDDHNYQYVVVEVDEERAGLSRDELMEVLWRENVIARRYFYPGCHRLTPYAAEHGGRSLPHTERAADRVLALPTGTAVTPTQIEDIGRLIGLALERADAVRTRLRELLDRGEWRTRQPVKATEHPPLRTDAGVVPVPDTAE